MRSFPFAGNHGESLENRGISRDKREQAKTLKEVLRSLEREIRAEKSDFFNFLFLMNTVL